jgi:hypothetical protein
MVAREFELTLAKRTALNIQITRTKEKREELTTIFFLYSYEQLLSFG